MVRIAPDQRWHAVTNRTTVISVLLLVRHHPHSYECRPTFVSSRFRVHKICTHHAQCKVKGIGRVSRRRISFNGFCHYSRTQTLRPMQCIDSREIHDGISSIMMIYSCLPFCAEVPNRSIRNSSCSLIPASRHLSLLLLLGLLHDLLDDLLLLDQESTDNTVLDAVGAARAAVCALDGLLWARDSGVLARAEGWDLYCPSCQRPVLSCCIVAISPFPRASIPSPRAGFSTSWTGFNVHRPIWSRSHRTLVQCLAS
jgi:hypothetical protein